MSALHFLWVWCGHLAALAVGVWAIVRGGWTERCGTLLIWFTWILTPIVQTKGVSGLDPGIFLVDLITFSGFVWLSLDSRKLWTAFASAFLLLTVVGHIAPLLSDSLSVFIYITNNGFWGGYALLGALTAGMIYREKPAERTLSKP